ncbi:MAG: PAS domain S-box protein [Alphaproteobacteria bacterium]|nr:PAS domain S-box protein [Alphaproteobacteria bacterium]MBU1515763.1 PAS domain S-box protein [Alphaproteobacteria bacterium]MBU2097046.1 PAS domain S-box protein [Alphaproteobacteria bacterium]MBU2149562.1 PAS domain S-box protein [Alphaproteobacteria bacterium]MBU2308948.1 PAS domain S-box protein [Alphaproteobacteria bacterium]
MRYLAASSRFLTDQGMPGDTPLVGRLHYEVFPAVPPRWRDLHTRALRDGEEFSHEADPYIDHDGKVEWIRWSLKPWRGDDGQIGGLVLYTEVVTPAVASRQRLEAAESRYRAVFDQAAVGVARVAASGRFLEVNERFCAITQYSRDDLLHSTFQAITHPDDLVTDIGRAQALLAGDIASYANEKRYVTKPGEVVWVNLTVSLVRDSHGDPAYFVTVIEDITVRKQAEAEQQRYQAQLRLMINELNHRVKNTLATVQSMAVQALRGGADPATAYERFESRLMGLAEVHDVLTRESWHGADLLEVAQRAMRPFAAAASGQVRIEGAAVWLQPRGALTMALVLHELATNAVKYGALSAEAGQVTLSWTFDPDAERLRLTWSEAGGPPVVKPTRRGFGSRLIERALRGDLQGSAAMTYAPTGLVCLMEAQLPKREGMLNLLDGI